MIRKKKIIKRCIIVGIVIALLTGGILLLRSLMTHKTVQVYPVSMLNQPYWASDQSMSATIESGSTQKVTLRKGIVNEVCVKEGETVKKGDVLMIYDVTSFQLTLQSDEARIAVLEAELARADRDLRKIMSLRPAEEKPEPQTHIIDHGPLVLKERLNEADLGGENTFKISPDTVITTDFLKALRSSGEEAGLSVYEQETLYGTFYLNGQKIPETVISYEEYVPGEEVFYEEDYPVEILPEDTQDPEESGEGITLYVRTEKDPLDHDWTLRPVLKFEESGASVLFNGESSYYGSFEACVPEVYERYETVIDEEEESEDYIYTREELSAMAREKQIEIKEKDIELRSARITYEQDKQIASDGKVKASASGVVSEWKDVTSLKEGDTIMKIKGNENYSVQVYVSEFDLPNIHPGDILNVNSYETGSSVTAKVTSVSKTPVSGNYGMGMANPNSSYFAVKAEVQEKDVELHAGEIGEATFLREEASAAVVLPLMYIRNDAGGSYVMKQEKGRLKKQYIMTGKNYYGYVMEIKQGLTEEDAIAFPYDAGEKEGAHTELSEELPEGQM